MEHYLGILELKREVGVALDTQILRRKWWGVLWAGKREQNKSQARSLHGSKSDE